eukprot:132210-Pelagomonas_calceolata.AAC.1
MELLCKRGRPLQTLKTRLTSSRPDATLVVAMKRVPWTNSREHSAPAIATLLASKDRRPSQLRPKQRRVHLVPVEVRYCKGTRPNNQLEVSKQQHRNLCRHLSRGSAEVTLHTNLLGVDGVIYTPHTLEPLKELGLDSHKTIKLALKLNAHSVQYAYKLVCTRRAFDKTSFNSQARATASNPPEHQ